MASTHENQSDAWNQAPQQVYQPPVMMDHNRRGRSITTPPTSNPGGYPFDQTLQGMGNTSTADFFAQSTTSGGNFNGTGHLPAQQHAHSAPSSYFTQAHTTYVDVGGHSVNMAANPPPNPGYNITPYASKPLSPALTQQGTPPMGGASMALQAPAMPMPIPATRAMAHVNGPRGHPTQASPPRSVPALKVENALPGASAAKNKPLETLGRIAFREYEGKMITVLTLLCTGTEGLSAEFMAVCLRAAVPNYAANGARAYAFTGRCVDAAWAQARRLFKRPAHLAPKGLHDFYTHAKNFARHNDDGRRAVAMLQDVRWMRASHAFFFDCRGWPTVQNMDGVLRSLEDWGRIWARDVAAMRRARPLPAIDEADEAEGGGGGAMDASPPGGHAAAADFLETLSEGTARPGSGGHDGTRGGAGLGGTHGGAHLGGPHPGAHLGGPTGGVNFGGPNDFDFAEHMQVDFGGLEAQPWSPDTMDFPHQAHGGGYGPAGPH